MLRLRSPAGLALFILLCLGAGRIGSMFTTANLPFWYSNLEKPSFTPPDIVFPIVWTFLYILMAVAVWQALRHAPNRQDCAVIIGVFLLQLVLNVSWSFVFLNFILLDLRWKF